MENSTTGSKPSHSTQPDQKTFIDPSYLKKGGALPQKRFSFLTFSLFIILITSLWIFLVTIEMFPNPFLQNSDFSVSLPTIKR